MLPNEERRTARSDDPLTALSMSFETARRRAEVDALVLTDPSGLTIAGAGPASLCDDLAARAAVLASPRPANDTVPCRLDVVTRALAVRRLRIDGIEVLLCAEGGAEESDCSLSDAAAACKRILARRSATLVGP